MVSEDSDLYRSRPDFAIAKRGVEPCRSRNQLVLDLTKSEVVDYLFGVISRLLTRNDISYIKWDKNRDMTEFYSDGLPFDRQGEFQHRYTLGFYDLADRLTRAFPNVLIEGCAGGGGRFDGGALYYLDERLYGLLRPRENPVRHFVLLSAVERFVPRFRVSEPPDRAGNAAENARRYRFAGRYRLRTRSRRARERRKGTDKAADPRLSQDRRSRADGRFLQAYRSVRVRAFRGIDRVERQDSRLRRRRMLPRRAVRSRPHNQTSRAMRRLRVLYRGTRADGKRQSADERRAYRAATYRLRLLDLALTESIKRLNIVFEYAHI